MLFPPGAPSRVPIAAVTGTNGKTTTARMLAHITKMGGYTPGLTTTDGVYIDGQRTVQGDMTGPMSAQMVLADPQIDIAVLETARGGLLRAGMGVKQVNVGAVLNVQSDHLGLKGIDTLEQLAEVKRVVIEVATDCAVLNADDPLVLKMSGYTEAKNICYVTMNPQHTLVREHIRAGGRACALEAGVNGQMITLYDRGSHIPLLWTHLIPATLEGRAIHNVQNAMFAAAMAFSLGIKLDAIRQGLRTFDTTFFQAPGRMNVFNEHPFKVRVRLRPQRARGRGDGRAGAAARRHRAAHRGRRRARRPSRRGSERDREGRRGSLRSLHLPSRRQPARPRAGRSAAHDRDGADRATACRTSRSRSFRTSRKRSTRRCNMGQPGDLLLVFADALVRSWKQITKFRPAGAPEPQARVAGAATHPRSPRPVAEPPPLTSLEGLLRDERGIRLAPEVDD